MGLVYREFSRQKYNKYKHQFPKMRESEIVNKIIREWDTLDFNAKRRLKKVYCQNRSLPNEDASESETAKKSEEARMTEQGSGKKEEANVGLKNVLEDAKATPLKKEWEERREDMKQETPTKYKTPGKVSCTDYVTFFRHYFDKYRREHPRWTPSQVSKIITLLWRKNKLNMKSKFKKGKLERSSKIRKLLSGKTAFKKLKKLNNKDSSRLWKRLPIESRRYW